MKISYNTLKKYIPNIKNVEDVVQDLIMHTAEVEEIIYQGASFNNIVIGEIKDINTHPDADKLSICLVNIGEENTQIVCGGTNLKLGQKVAVAKIGAQVSWHGTETITMKKMKIRGIESSGMICASEEIGLKNEFPAQNSTEILDLSNLDVTPGDKLSQILKKDDYYLDIDNKAINHRPDLFSHIGIMREICVINGEKFDFDFENKNFSGFKKLDLENTIPKIVKRYMGIKISGVENSQTPEYIKEVIFSHGIDSKGLLVDITNYSLYFYGQPTHIFDADKIKGAITIRFAKEDEDFLGLDNKKYKLSETDIVVADNEKVLALGGIIGGKESAVSDTTKNIIIESANFDQAIIRKTGKILGLRTDSLNVFEKDLLPEMANRGASLIISELQKVFPELKIEEFIDSYEIKQKNIEIDYDLNFINNLIGKEYTSEVAEKIIKNLGMELLSSPKGRYVATVKVPFWRKELNYKADIAEEIARIDGFNNIKTTPPSINTGAITQSNTYKIKSDTRSFFTSKGFFDMYNYSFVNEELMNKLEGNCKNLISLKNALSAELTHMKGNLIPNLMNSLKKNIRENKDLKLFEIEKVFKLVDSVKEKKVVQIEENYEVASVITSNKKIPYYDIQKIVTGYLRTIGVDNFSFDKSENIPTYSHSGRTAKIIARGQEIGFVGEIHPEISKKFDVKSRVAFFYINIDKISNMAYNITKVTEISQFQMNNFDLNFVVDKSIKGKNIKTAIANTDKKLIKKIELFDIFENEEKLPGKRSLSFKIYIQSEEGTLDDKVKNSLIEDIKKNVEKKGGELR